MKERPKKIMVLEEIVKQIEHQRNGEEIVFPVKTTPTTVAGD